jgi:hypothetical protein
VNVYRPGQGIPLHTDTHNCCTGGLLAEGESVWEWTTVPGTSSGLTKIRISVSYYLHGSGSGSDPVARILQFVSKEKKNFYGFVASKYLAIFVVNVRCLQCTG